MHQVTEEEMNPQETHSLTKYPNQRTDTILNPQEDGDQGINQGPWQITTKKPREPKKRTASSGQA